MRKLKVSLGVGIELAVTGIALAIAAWMCWLFEESVHFRGASVCLGISCAVCVVWYLIWYLVKEKQTRDMDMRHYRGWMIHMSASMVIGAAAGCAPGILFFSILDYSYWIYFVIIAVGILLQLGGAVTAYVCVRPR